MQQSVIWQRWHWEREEERKRSTNFIVGALNDDYAAGFLNQSICVGGSVCVWSDNAQTQS